MKIEITKEKVKAKAKEYYNKAKTWVTENTEKVIVGAGVTLGVVSVAAAVASGRKSDDVGKPLVIDVSKDDWKDQLNSLFTVDGKPVTIRQEESMAALNNYFYGKVLHDKLLPEATIRQIGTEFCKNYPDRAKVLDTIDGFWM